MTSQVSGILQMALRRLLVALGSCVLSSLQLHDHAREPLRQVVVNVASHSITLVQHSCALALLREFIQLNGEHCLMSERLRQFDFLGSIRRPVFMPNADEPVHTATDYRWDGEKLFRSV